MNSCVEDHSTHIVIIFSFRPHGLTCFISDTLLPQNADPPALFLQSSIRYSAPIHHPKPENECLVLSFKTRQKTDSEPHIATSERIYRDHPTTAARRCRGPLAIAPPEQVHRRPESLEQRGVSGCDHVGPKPREQVTTSSHTRLHEQRNLRCNSEILLLAKSSPMVIISVKKDGMVQGTGAKGDSRKKSFF
jgi:hypothetical protein